MRGRRIKEGQARSLASLQRTWNARRKVVLVESGTLSCTHESKTDRVWRAGGACEEEVEGGSGVVCEDEPSDARSAAEPRSLWKRVRAKPGTNWSSWKTVAYVKPISARTSSGSIVVSTSSALGAGNGLCFTCSCSRDILRRGCEAAQDAQKMSSTPAKRAKGAGSKKSDGDVDWARKKLRDGQDGRPGSLATLLSKITAVREQVRGGWSWG
jgi:hypothetical protein